MSNARNFSWLHLTDLHFGLSGQDHLWPNIREAFYNDLRDLHSRCGPWQAVLFTGDLVQSGAAAEYDGLTKLLDELWEQFRELGSDPILLVVPGNHDLVRPDLRDPTTLVLNRWQQIPEMHRDFWGNAESAYRKVIDKVFQNYTNWWTAYLQRQGEQFQTGCLPGDFSTTLEAGGLRVGIVGLNTTFLQLAAGDYLGKLAWHTRQFHLACGGDGPNWLKKHHLAILLTHQGPDWLDSDSRTRIYTEINPAGRFAVHLFGHMHDNVLSSVALGGGSALRTWQGHSLFGLEHYGDGKLESRRHGYAAGQIQVKGNAGLIRHWPRVAKQYQQDGWLIIPDYESCILQNDQGTRADPVDFRQLDGDPDDSDDNLAAAMPDAHPFPNVPDVNSPTADAALQAWKEKLSFYQLKLAITSDPAQKFNLRKLIDEAQSSIRSLQSAAATGP